MNFFKRLFGKKEETSEFVNQEFIVVSLNDKIQPIDRGCYYEDDLEEILQSNNIGEITGGGTMQEENGEIRFVDISIALYEEEISDDKLNIIIKYFEDKGVPKNSKITIEKTGKEIYFGKKEGLGIYLDGKNLDDEVYQNCSSNFVYSELNRLIGDGSENLRYWESEEKTALYFYGDSFVDMKNTILEFVNEYPLCENAEIKQIA